MEASGLPRIQTQSQNEAHAESERPAMLFKGIAKSAPCSPHKGLKPPASSVDDLQKEFCRSDSFHVIHKVPVGDSPYVRAKHVQVGTEPS
jgi:hypothetical protein